MDFITIFFFWFSSLFGVNAHHQQQAVSGKTMHHSAASDDPIRGIANPRTVVALEDTHFRPAQ